jgi:predicted DNA-binding transcriptional regulator AlpA
MLRLHTLIRQVNILRLTQMSPRIRTEDLIDARGIATLLSLSHPNSVSTYQRRYRKMPRPVVDLGAGRCRLWLRSEIETWASQTGRRLSDQE